jgi:hypothetical protein
VGAYYAHFVKELCCLQGRVGLSPPVTCLVYSVVLLIPWQVMDETAVTLCKENNIPVIVFNAMQPGNILRAAMGEDVGTVVSHADTSLAPPTRIIIAESTADTASS